MAVISNRFANIIAAVLLFALFLTAFFSMKQDALTFDELAHIPAGYSYLTQKDYRLNPEHPPLIKDLAALPLLFLNLNFPKNDQTWLQDNYAPAWWVQFDFGRKFLYESGNNPKKIIFWSRLPMIFLLVFLGWFLFKWAKELGGNYAGLAVLALFSFSPEFIGHGRLVTTDSGAALGAVMSVYFWLKFLKNPKKTNVFLAGVFLGIALLIKFSLVLLIPFFLIIAIIYAGKHILKYIIRVILAGIISLLIIWPVYQLHVINYPAERQVRDTKADLSGEGLAPLKNLTIWMADKPLLRPWAQFSRGVLMATQRTTSGNTVYFLGKISASGWWYYFPVIYLLKIPLAFHALALLTLLSAAIITIKRKLVLNIKQNFAIFSFAIFLAIYWFTAITGNLNIGVRHLLPTFPFIYLLVVLLFKKAAGKLSPILILLLIWYIASSILSFPNYLSYFNELAGGMKNGYKYAVDSNYDWGQDFYKLVNFVEKNNIEKIHLDYFGGESPKYWLEEKYVQLNPMEPPSGWLAVSANQMMGGMARPVPGFDQPTNYYKWLNDYELKAMAGNSIFIYYKD